MIQELLCRFSGTLQYITRAIVSIKRSMCKLLCVIETVVHRNSNRLKSGMLWQQEQLDLPIEGNMRVLLIFDDRKVSGDRSMLGLTFSNRFLNWQC